MKQMSLKSKLKFEVPLTLKGFEQLIEKFNNQDRTFDPKNLIQLMFDQKTAQQQFDIFKENALNAIGKKYLPIYRMADGEFNFCLYKKKLNFKLLIKKFLFRMPIIKTMWGEEYFSQEYDKAYEIFQKIIKKLSAQGVLAIHFLKNSYYSDSLKTMKWFDENKIEIHSKNYTSFYFVYALLSSKERWLVYRGKNILVITGANDTKKKK